MKFNFDLAQPINDKLNQDLTPSSPSSTNDKPNQHQHQNQQQQRQTKSLTPYSPSSSSTPKDQLQWLPLQNNPFFSSSSADDSDAGKSSTMRGNLMAWDGASRIYFWDSHHNCLHRISVRLGEPDPTSVLAAFPSKVLKADVDLDFVVTRISINRNGSALLLADSHDMRVMYLYGRSSGIDSSIICRTVPIGSDIFQNSNNAIRILQAMWHPYSDTHLAVLSSDSVFRAGVLFAVR